MLLACLSRTRREHLCSPGTPRPLPPGAAPMLQGGGSAHSEFSAPLVWGWGGGWFGSGSLSLPAPRRTRLVHVRGARARARIRQGVLDRCCRRRLRRQLVSEVAAVVLVSIVVRIPACHVGGRVRFPSREATFPFWSQARPSVQLLAFSGSLRLAWRPRVPSEVGFPPPISPPPTCPSPTQGTPSPQR